MLNGPTPSALHSASSSLSLLTDYRVTLDVPDDDGENKMTADATVLPPNCIDHIYSVIRLVILHIGRWVQVVFTLLRLYGPLKF